MVVGDQSAVRAGGRRGGRIDAVVLVAVLQAIVMHITANNGVVTAFLVNAGVKSALANFHVVESDEVRVVACRATDADCWEDIAGRTLKDQPAGIDSVAAAGALRRAAESHIGTINARRALQDGDFTGVVGENDRITGGAGIVFHLVVTRSGRYILRIGPATETDSLPGGSRIESLLYGFPGSGKRARIRVRAGRRNIERARGARQACHCQRETAAGRVRTGIVDRGRKGGRPGAAWRSTDHSRRGKSESCRD